MSKNRVLGWAFAVAVLMVLFPPVGVQSSTYGHIRMTGFAPVWAVGGRVVNNSFLIIELAVIVVFGWLYSRDARNLALSDGDIDAIERAFESALSSQEHAYQTAVETAVESAMTSIRAEEPTADRTLTEGDVDAIEGAFDRAFTKAQCEIQQAMEWALAGFIQGAAFSEFVEARFPTQNGVPADGPGEFYEGDFNADAQGYPLD